LNAGECVTILLAKVTVLAYMGGVDGVKNKFSLTSADQLSVGLTAQQATSVPLWTVGDPTLGYTPPNNNWGYADGTNPPTFSMIRLQDQTTGVISKVKLVSGSLVVE
jgi:hypothetical protein